MSIKLKNPFSKQHTFRDITKNRQDIVKIASGQSTEDVITRVHQCNETIIIHSKNDETNHVSISNSKGYGYVQEWEIIYAIDRILKVENKDVIMYVGKTGVIHLRTQDGSTVINQRKRSSIHNANNK